MKKHLNLLVIVFLAIVGFSFGCKCFDQNGDPCDCPPINPSPTSEFTFEGKTLATQTFPAKAHGVVHWEGKVRAGDTSGVMRELSFLVTGDYGNLENFSAYTSSGSTITLEESGQLAYSDQIVFALLDENGTRGIYLDAGEEIGLKITSDVESTLYDFNGDVVFSSQLTLDVDRIEVEDLNGDVLGVANESDILGPVNYYVQAGTLEIDLGHSQTPRSSIQIAGTEGVLTAVYQFDADYEDAEVEKLTVVISDICTAATLGKDVQFDAHAVASVSLIYMEDGTSVFTNNGIEAINRSVSYVDGVAKAVLSNLDLRLEDVESNRIGIVVGLNEISETDLARSGMAFTTSFSFAPGDYEISGRDSGFEYGDENIMVADEDQDCTETGEPIYIMNNKVVLAKASLQEEFMIVGVNEALKFIATPAGDGDTDTSGVKASVIPIRSSEGDFVIKEIILRDGALILDKIQGDDLSGEFLLEPGTCNDCIASDPVNSRDVILTSGETLTIDLVIESSGGRMYRDDKVTVAISINGGNPLADGFIWQDYGTNGTDGVEMAWIDLGADTVTSKIANSLTGKE